MIEITYYRKYSRVTVAGHAMTDEYGKDLVCSAASILANTLADRVRVFSNQSMVRGAVTNMEPGNTEISCNPTTHYKSIVTMVFDTICAGFELLAQSFPDSVKFVSHEG